MIELRRKIVESIKLKKIVNVSSILEWIKIKYDRIKQEEKEKDNMRDESWM